jgi:hypothetical protein
MTNLNETVSIATLSDDELSLVSGGCYRHDGYKSYGYGGHGKGGGSGRGRGGDSVNVNNNSNVNNNTNIVEIDLTVVGG